MAHPSRFQILPLYASQCHFSRDTEQTTPPSPSLAEQGSIDTQNFTTFSKFQFLKARATGVCVQVCISKLERKAAAAAAAH